MYGIILKENNRIGSVYAEKFIPDGAIRVETVPEDDLWDYVYQDGKFIYDPLPVPEPSEPQPTQEERIAALEAQLASYEAAYTEGVNEA